MAFKMNYKKGGFPFKSAFKQVPTFVGTGTIKDLVAPLGEMSAYERRKLIEKGKKAKKDRENEEEFKKDLNTKVKFELPTAPADNTRTNIRVHE
tara:strand:- start:345 stop:626 length:282 start_codon:yes stop_codon:yes gene_type:complete